MATPDSGEIFLHPGEFYFGNGPERIRTVLGSCVAVTMWHPVRRRGGMAHGLLPSRRASRPCLELNGRFVDEAICWLLREAVRSGLDPSRCEFKVFGGSNMFAASGVAGSAHPPIGEGNTAGAVALLEHLGLDVRVKDFGGTVHRALVFDLASGDVWVRYGSAACGDFTGEIACA